MTALSPACRVCGSRRHHYLCRTWNEHSPTHWLDNYLCRDCGSVFIGNVLSAAELAQAYAAVDEAAYYRETAQTSTPKFAAAARDISELAGNAAAVLDLGGGDGAFARAVAARGFGNLSVHEIPGAELPDLPEAVRGVYRDTDYASIPNGAFDVVTLMDVLEHVPDVGATLAAARRVLRPGGVLYVHTPAVTVLDRAMHIVQRLPLLGGVGRAWQRARTSVYHLQNFTPRALRQLMARYGFDIVRLDRINELSWPIDYYVRVYLVQLRGVPEAFVVPLTLLLTPLLRSRLNANKAVLVARARGPQ
jgi:2-polyprenyl-3-methyl-5-hydroxy-6-metoxy-1,4-benzoquinol methylase